jgi:hypothetical protein
VDRPVHAAAAPHGPVGGVDDRVDLLHGDVARDDRDVHVPTLPLLRADQRGQVPALQQPCPCGSGAAYDAGVVEFAAHYLGPNGAGTLHERSTFERRDGRCVYGAGDN